MGKLHWWTRRHQFRTVRTGGVPLTFVEHLREVLGMVERDEWTGCDYQHSSNRFFVTKYDWENVVTAKEKCESMTLVNEIVVVQLC